MKTKTRNIAIGLVALSIVGSLIAAGGLLGYYGKVTTTANVQQSIVVSMDGTTWNNYNEPMTRTINEMVHCTDYCEKKWIQNRACEDTFVELDINYLDAPTWDGGFPDFEGYDIDQYVFGETQTISLIQKEIVWGQSPWLPLDGGEETELTFRTCNNEFTWEITGDFVDYSLIYYSNYPEYWEGTGPVTVLGSGMSGSIDVPSMPYAEDENALRPISDEGETYEHQYGAKFWLVPTAAILPDDTLDWEQADLFLFETDLGFYTDCSELNPVKLALVWGEFNMYDGTSVLIKSEQTYCWITCDHVDIDIIPGEYIYEQIVKPGPLQQI